MYCDKVTKNKTKIRKSLFVWGFVLIMLIATTTAGAKESTGEPAQIIEKFEVEENFEVQKALAMLGSLCDKNIVPSPNVTGVLNFRSLKNITFEDAMDAILGEKFVYEQEGELVKVYTKEEYKTMKEDPARMVYEVFTLYYITAAEAQNLITPLLTGGSDAKIQVTSPAEQGISGGSGGSSASGASGGGGGGSLGSGGSGDALAMHDTIVVFDYPENIEDVGELLATLDVRPKQVLVEATILSALLQEGMQLGVDWNFAAGVPLDGSAATNTIVGPDTVHRGSAATSPIEGLSNLATGTPIETAGFATQGNGGLRLGITTGDVRVLITALESITDVTVLANPKILTLNKQEGSLLIGRKLGYKAQTTQNQTSTTQAVKFLETGTRLVFRPYIGNDGYIRMDIYPKDSSAEPDADGIPQETTTELQTNILVKDGETIVIGGLFRDVITTTRNQVPLLGDIPIIGALFRGTTDLNQREEVIVMLTPHIIEEPSEVDGVERADDVRRKRFGAKDELQDIGRAKMADDSYAKAAGFYLEGNNESAMKQLKVALALRPSYLEAIRLKERIIAESSPEEAQKIERIMLEAVESKDTAKWHRK